MKICIASDLHFEFHEDQADWLPPLPDNCDVMILAGDIGVGDFAIEAVSRISEAIPMAQVIFVAGNHEFYNTSIDSQISKYRKAFQNKPRIHYLENEEVEIGGIRFLGCTLWSGFDLYGKEHVRTSINAAEQYIPDFQIINDQSGSTLFKPARAVERYRESRRWLINSLKQSDPEKNVVITHFPPCRSAQHQKIPENNLTPYFQASCQDLIHRFQPAAWVYGHNHWSLDFDIGWTRVVSNQLGYPEEHGSLPDYDPNKIINI